jgi:hypothetical protein
VSFPLLSISVMLSENNCRQTPGMRIKDAPQEQKGFPKASTN